MNKFQSTWPVLLIDTRSRNKSLLKRTSFTTVIRVSSKRRESTASGSRCSVSMHCTRRIPISYHRRPEFTRGTFRADDSFLIFPDIGYGIRSVHHSAGIRTFRPTLIYFLCRRRRRTCLHLMLPSSFFYLADQPTASLKYGQIARRVILLPLVALISGFPKRLVHGSSTGNSQRTWNSSTLSH